MVGGIVIYALGNRGFQPWLQAYLTNRFSDPSMARDLGVMRTVYLLIESLGPMYARFTVNTLGFIPAYGSLLVLYLIGPLLLL